MFLSVIILKSLSRYALIRDIERDQESWGCPLPGVLCLLRPCLFLFSLSSFDIVAFLQVIMFWEVLMKLPFFLRSVISGIYGGDFLLAFKSHMSSIWNDFLCNKSMECNKVDGVLPALSHLAMKVRQSEDPCSNLNPSLAAWSLLDLAIGLIWSWSFFICVMIVWFWTWSSAPNILFWLCSSAFDSDLQSILLLDPLLRHLLLAILLSLELDLVIQHQELNLNF